MKNKPGRKGKEIIAFVFVLLVFTIYFSATAVAEMYKWIDDKEEMHITDSPPPAAKLPAEIKVYKDSRESNLDMTPASAGKKEGPRPSFESQKKVDVVLYTTNWCPYCRKARDYLRARGISFIEYDIEKDKEAAIRKRQLDNSGVVPFAIINGRSISGFSASAYERALTQ